MYNQKALNIEYWNQLLAMERQLVGPHFPNITNALFKKWAAIGEIIMKRMSSSNLKEWKDLSIEMKKEFIITHGKEHPDYYKIIVNLKQMDLITKMTAH